MKIGYRQVQKVSKYFPEYMSYIIVTTPNAIVADDSIFLNTHYLGEVKSFRLGKLLGYDDGNPVLYTEKGFLEETESDLIPYISHLKSYNIKNGLNYFCWVDKSQNVYIDFIGIDDSREFRRFYDCIMLL